MASSVFLSACATAAVAPPGVKADLSSTEVSDGSIVIVTLQVPSDLKDSVILGNFEGTEIPFFQGAKEGSYEAVLGVPHSHKPGPAQIEVKIGEGEKVKNVILPIKVVEGNYRSETLSVNPRMINPSKKDLVRIKREQAEIGEIYRHLTKQKYWSGPFVLPIKSDITSPYGTKRVFNGELQSFHTGLDLRAPLKTPIYAAAPGVVVMAKHLFYTGKTVFVDHGYGVITLYAHMSQMKVKKGQTIKTGDLLGLSGQTGRVSGPHLHWQAIVHKVKVNPLELTKVMR